LKHFKINENFDRENHFPQQFFPLMNVALPPKTSSDESSELPNNSECGEGGGGRGSISAIFLMFLYREIEKYAC